MKNYSSLSRFYCPGQVFGVGKKITLHNKDLCHQLKSVLRLQKEDLLRVFNGDGSDYICEIELLTKKECVFVVQDTIEMDTELAQNITLYQAVPNRASKFERVVNDGTQLGVSRFVPILTERVQKPFLGKKDRIQKIIIEAAEQSERTIVPELAEEAALEDILKNPPQGTNILLYTRGESGGLVDVSDTVNIFVGPEGGFTEKEVAAAKDAGFHIVTLGKRVLRTELAGAVFISRLFD